VLAADEAGTGAGTFAGSIGALAAVTAVLGIAAAVRREQEELLSELTARHAQARVLDVACAAELAAFDEPAFHDRIARAQAGVFRTPMVVFGLAQLATAAAGVVGALGALLSIEPLLAPLALLVLVPAWLVTSRRGEAFYRFACGMTPRDRERSYLASLLTGRDPAKEARAFQLAGYLRARHDRLYAERVAELRRVAGRQVRFAVAANLASALIVGGTLALLVALALGDRLELAAAAAAGGAIVMLGQRLVMAGYGAGQLYESALFLRDLVSLESPPARTAPAPAPAEAVHVVAEHLTFSYPGAGRPALQDVSLGIAPGEVVALVGDNGSGKTTLAKLLAALYVPSSGRVVWNGAATAELDRDRLRRDGAVIFQDFLRYSLPARDNIALGRHERAGDEASIRAAARESGADADLAALRDGYDTRLGPVFEGGTDVSLGQWQRIALARVFFRDAPFVILDEPTAALDARAESRLFEAIRTLLAGRTVLLISHRFSSVRSADRIHVLDGGRIVESGSHETLMSEGGRYAELFTLQAAAYTDGSQEAPSLRADTGPR
ncbi:MAG TPA: ABC transporter ATP-binding protein, partial [Solirubrobacteraceae bacterium]|nr:ABC transporter ATP-binding protein [Solirubrobacteraceae bacterium]